MAKQTRKLRLFLYYFEVFPAYLGFTSSNCPRLYAFQISMSNGNDIFHTEKQGSDQSCCDIVRLEWKRDCWKINFIFIYHALLSILLMVFIFSELLGQGIEALKNCMFSITFKNSCYILV